MPGEEPVASTSGDAGTEEPAMTLEQFKEQLTELNKGLRSLPATAQVNLLAAAACLLQTCCCCLLHTRCCCWCFYSWFSIC